MKRLIFLTALIVGFSVVFGTTTRYVDRASAVGGDGTTNSTSGANRVRPGLVCGTDTARLTGL